MNTLTRHWLTVVFLLVFGSIRAQTNYLPDNMDSVGCSIAPEPQPWAIVQGRTSEFLSHMYAQPLVGDIDNDGRSEVVTAGYQAAPRMSSSVVIYDDQLQHRTTINTPEMYVYGGYPIAIADVDRDGFGEIFIHADNGFVYCYRYNGTTSTNVWTSNTPTTSELRSAILIIADINGDGHSVICALNKIFNAETGEEMLTLPEIIGQSDFANVGYTAMPVFADYDNDGILELAGGNKVYKLQISNYNGTTGNTAELWKTISGNGTGDGVTSTADIDMDGFLDVVVVRNNYMYAWKPYTGINSNPTLISACTYPSSYPGSRALLADVNNDGYPEILFNYAVGMTAYRYDPNSQSLQLMWQQQTSDLGGATVMTAFDFNQDGSVEVVYRDESHMRIIDGVTGLNQAQFECLAPTDAESSIIVDLDRDGQAEIITSHSTYDVDHDFHANLIVFHAPANTTWAPARYVWNQHAYNTVNVNNDLTIPTTNFNPATAFTGPDNIVRRPFNNFLQQGTQLDQYGRPYFPGTPTELDLTASLCMGESYIDDFFIISSDTLSVGEYEFQRVIEHEDECDSIITLQITISMPSSTEISDTICRGQGYHQHGFHIPESSTLNGGELTESLVLQNQVGCDSIVTLRLTLLDGELHILPPTEDFCKNNSARLAVATSLDRFRWSTGEETQEIVVTHPGTYSVEAISGHCTAADAITIAACDFDLFLPTAITPSKDEGTNDYFCLLEQTAQQLEEFEIHIYNRWGGLVYHSTTPYFRWDGIENGKLFPNNIYSYVILCKPVGHTRFIRTGTIVVL